MKKFCVLLLSALLSLSTMADDCEFFTPALVEENDESQDSTAIVSNSLWHNCFGQLGVDMSLMNPYGCNIAHVFPKGMAFGMDAALGKWFTPEFGGRGRINVENAFFQIDKAEWWQRCSDGCIILNADFLIDLFLISSAVTSPTVVAEKGGVYNVCDTRQPSFGEISMSIARQLGKGKPLNLPYWLAWCMAKVGDLLGNKAPINTYKLEKMTKSLTFSNEKARRELGWEPMDVLENYKV